MPIAPAKPLPAFRLRELKEALPEHVEFPKFVLEVYKRVAERRAVDFKENIVDWILACRRDRGIPILSTTYAETRFEPKGTVLGKCWAGRGMIEGTWFKNTPQEDIERMEREGGDWRWLMRKYAPEKYEEAMGYPVEL